MSIQGDEREYATPTWMKWGKISIFLMLGILVCYDIPATYNKFRGDTISEITLWAALKSLTLPAAWGIVTGHLFWPGSRRPVLWHVLLFFGLTLAVLLPFDLVVAFASVRWGWLMFLHSMPIITVLVFIPLGRLFWQQARQR